MTNVGDHFVYNLDTGVWRTAAPMPDPKDHFSTAVLNGKIYVLGGEHGHDQLNQQETDLDVYNPVTDTWTSLTPLPIAKSHIESGTFVLDGKIVMAGGQTDNFQPTANVVAYDPDTNSWSGLPPLPAVRQGAIVRAVGGAVYITLGGTQTNSPQSQTWIGQLPAVGSSSAAQMSTAARNRPIDTPALLTSAVTGGLVGKTSYAVGDDGSIVASDVETGETHVVSPASDRPFAGEGGAVVIHRKKLFLFGGEGAAAGKVQVYNTVRNRWKVGRSMPFAAGDSAVTVLKGKAYLLGGVVNNEASTAVARYDLAKNRWRSLPEMVVPLAGAYADADRANLYVGAGRLTSAAGELVDVMDNRQQILNFKTGKWAAYGIPGQPEHPPASVGG